MLNALLFLQLGAFFNKQKTKIMILFLIAIGISLLAAACYAIVKDEEPFDDYLNP